MGVARSRRGDMGRKGKTQKHTAAETAAKHKAAKEAQGAAGGGGAGTAARKNAGAKASVACIICMTQQPNMKSMEAHFDSKHSKLKWSEEGPKYQAMFDQVKGAVFAADKGKQSKK